MWHCAQLSVSSLHELYRVGVTQSYLFLCVESALGFLGEKYLRVETWEGGTVLHTLRFMCNMFNTHLLHFFSS